MTIKTGFQMNYEYYSPDFDPQPQDHVATQVYRIQLEKSWLRD